MAEAEKAILMTSNRDVHRYKLRFDGASDLDNEDYSHYGKPVSVGQQLILDGQSEWVVSAIIPSDEGVPTLHLSRSADESAV